MSKNIKLKRFTDEEYTEVINFMASNRKDHDPKVGLFWYDADKDELFTSQPDNSNNYKGEVVLSPSGYLIRLGEWIKYHPDVIDLIIIEFNLPEDTIYTFYN